MRRLSVLFVVLVGLVAGLGVACEEPVEKGPVWTPGQVYEAPRKDGPQGKRGYLDVRGLIHAHSYYSHDACDGEPQIDGVYDEICFDDFRRGVCQTKHDFIFLTDHRDSFNDNEFPDVLLYREERGDELVMRNDFPVANRSACEDGHEALIMAGNEAAMMPVGLEGHVAPREERSEIYGTRSPENIQKLKDAGAVVIMQHPEDYSSQDLIDWPVDGFEMFNLHAAFFRGMGMALELLFRLDDERPGLGHPDLFFIPVVTEDERYLERWANVAISGERKVTTMGTDCHRNTLETELEDGERADSYRRMMLWFSNHLLIRPEADGSWDDRHLKEALRDSRLYGAFEVFGYPVGFDTFIEGPGGITEMGQEVAFSDDLKLTAKMPAIQNLDPEAKAPDLTLRVLKAEPGEWIEMTSTKKDELAFVPEGPGAYRVEVRITPHHLEDFLGDDAYWLLEENWVWIYANTFYVR
jgi:hypothetical protein